MHSRPLEVRTEPAPIWVHDSLPTGPAKGVHKS